MDAAGLSPGLMYGKGGAGGGGAGSTTGAPMGATGAAGAGAAADPNAQLQALMSLRQIRMNERKNEAEINLLDTQAEALKAQAGKDKEETQSIIDKRIWEVKQEMFKGWKGFIISMPLVELPARRIFLYRISKTARLILLHPLPKVCRNSETRFQPIRQP